MLYLYVTYVLLIVSVTIVRCIRLYFSSRKTLTPYFTLPSVALLRISPLHIDYVLNNAHSCFAPLHIYTYTMVEYTTWVGIKFLEKCTFYAQRPGKTGRVAERPPSTAIF